MTKAFLSRFLGDRTAAAAAEMALVMPMLFALIFTTFEGGHYMWTEHKALKGVRDGARFAARLPFDYFSCSSSSLVTPTGATVSAATRETQIKNLTRTGQIGAGGNPKIPGWGQQASDVTISVACAGTYTGGLYSGMTGGAPHVTVSTVVPYPAILGLLGFDTSALGVRAQANAAVTGL